MNLKYLTDRFLARLRGGVPSNAGKYESGKTFLDEFAAGTTYLRESGMEILDLPSLVVSSNASDDAENAIRLFNALPKLSQVQAMDERLWAYLSHGPYWEYMTARW